MFLVRLGGPMPGSLSIRTASSDSWQLRCASAQSCCWSGIFSFMLVSYFPISSTRRGRLVVAELCPTRCRLWRLPIQTPVVRRARDVLAPEGLHSADVGQQVNEHDG